MSEIESTPVQSPEKLRADSVYPRREPEPRLPLTNSVTRLIIVTPSIIVAVIWLLFPAFHHNLLGSRMQELCIKIVVSAITTGLVLALTQIRRVRFNGFLLTLAALIVAFIAFMLIPVYS